MSDQKLNQFNTPEESEQEWIREFGPIEEEISADPEQVLAERFSPDEEEEFHPYDDEPTGVVHWAGPSRGQWPQVLRTPGQEALPHEENEEEELPQSLSEEQPVEESASRRKIKSLQKRWEEKVHAEAIDAEEERQYQPIRFSRQGRIGCLGGILYAIFMICLSIVLACFMWMAASDVLALNKPDYTVEITLPEEIFYDKEVDVLDEDGNVTGKKTIRAADIDKVSGILRDYGVINYKWLFKLYSSFSSADEQLDPGNYVLKTNYDYRAMVKKMQKGSGAMLQTLVTLPEGYSMEQIFTKLEENDVCDKADLYEAAANASYSYAFLEGAETGNALRLEGYLFPDTYYFYVDMQASSVINKFLSAMHYKVTEEMLQQAANMGMSFRDILTVASIVEKEAANDEERALIASVIYNRLNNNMMLQMDSIIHYGLALAGRGDETISMDLIQQLDSPYNCYKNVGLPPNPISNPGMASIQAALHPAATNYLYFALDKATDTHRFFLYAEEHAEFVSTQDYS